MRPERRKTLLNPQQSFSIIERHTDYFDIPWHLHEEFELLYVCRSEGKRYVGDSIENFRQGDLVLLGPNLPHCWLNDNIEYCKGRFFDTRYKVIHFDQNCLGYDFFNIPEMQVIKKLLDSASRGIQIRGEIVYKISYMMYEMLSFSYVDRVISLLRILKDISEWEDKLFISSEGFINQLPLEEDNSIRQVKSYLLENFKSEVNLQNVSEKIGMTTTSFCRYFKRATGKTFIKYLAEFRIGYACQLIQNSDMTFSEVAYESGYESISHFYKQFKDIIGSTPSEYKKNLKDLNLNFNPDY
jgi:AraC-like DNA-binding protein